MGLCMSNLTIALLGGMLGMLGFGTSNFLAKKTIGVLSNLQVLVFSQFIGVGFMVLYLTQEPALPALTPTNLAFALVFGLLNASAYVLRSEMDTARGQYRRYFKQIDSEILKPDSSPAKNRAWVPSQVSSRASRGG